MKAGGRQHIYYGKRDAKIKIYGIADIHYGNRGSHMEMFLKDVQKIKNDPHAFWIGGGDYADYVGLGDKRFDPRVLADDMIIDDLGALGYVLTRRIRDFFEPIKHKCLGLVFGNHEDKYQKTNQQMQLHQWLCTELGVKNLGYCALLDVVFARASRTNGAVLEQKARHTNSVREAFTKRFFVHHGAGGATTPGGKMNRLIKFMNAFDADIYMVGHVHDKIARRFPMLSASPTCNEIREKNKVGFVTGSYLKTYTEGMTSYGEVKGYDPVPLGALSVDIETGTQEAYVRI